ncbi:MAG TPA: bifunctional glutamate N-acetyltransferase/amino-acid acetyltransferase ArgJ [Acidothermaceae bacterium]|nr:bifunctional glutamate N-acetyltransferase/amino-acid acetyltransferase ArgJ [Acidothermaceae bacterium]
MSVTAAKGFRAAGVVAGIKPSGRSDVALVVNDGPLRYAAGVFTGNRIKAAPVLWSQQVVKGGQVVAVVLNAGNANACTGALGFQHAHRTAEEVGALLDDSAAQVAVCSTGLIGEYLPIDKLLAGVHDAHVALAGDGGNQAAMAIMTTDTVPKAATVSSPAGWTVGGMAKGAAMLAPGLATMLVVLTTDVVADAATLDRALRAATAKTFDRLDSDGCMSTNDTVLLLASGASGIEVDDEELAEAVTQVCATLADKLIDDCEGASKVIEIEVLGAASDSEAVDVARAVSRSNLLKCAIHGEDPNWGRILSALGTTAATFDDDGVDVAINGVWICRASTIGDDRTLVDMSARRVAITIDLHAGVASAKLLTTDLTAEYVRENSAYST